MGSSIKRQTAHTISTGILTYASRMLTAWWVHRWLDWSWVKDWWIFSLLNGMFGCNKLHSPTSFSPFLDPPTECVSARFMEGRMVMCGGRLTQLWWHILMDKFDNCYSMASCNKHCDKVKHCVSRTQSNAFSSMGRERDGRSGSVVGRWQRLAPVRCLTLNAM